MKTFDLLKRASLLSLLVLMAGIVLDINAKDTFVNCFIRGNKEGIWNEGVLLMYNCVIRVKKDIIKR